MAMYGWENITILERGGYVIKTSAGMVQFGVPPETIKDTMRTKGGVPAIYVLPQKLFSIDRGISFAEMEFPIYFNFYIIRKPVIVICSKQHQERLIRVMKEALFGPEVINLEPEYKDGRHTPDFPNMEAEMAMFRAHPKTGKFSQIEDYIQFVELSHDVSAKIGNVQIRYNKDNDFEVLDNDQLLVAIDGKFSLPTLKVSAKDMDPPFYPPIFGVTTLGNSYGFDPEAKNSGLIVWINRRGIMVDPPVDSTAWLLEHEVSAKLIDSVILTHCHADHDAGTLQKILEEQKINLYSTRTIFESFLRKSEALTGLDVGHLRQLVDFRPVAIGQPMKINGGEFWFRYELHSIPTIGFEVFFQTKSLVYTSDHLYDPRVYQEMFEKGSMSKARMDFFMNFPWNSDIIIHECGIPPLHTPVECLLSLQPEIKSRIYLVHTNEKSLPPKSGFRIAPVGLENTLILDANPQGHNAAVEALDSLSQVELFKDFNLRKAKEFLMTVKVEKYLMGEKLIFRGIKGRNFFIILSGKVIISRNGGDYIGSNNDFFGETSIILDEPSSIEVTAKTDVVVLMIGRQDFLNFIEGTSVSENVRNLERNRNTPSWKLMEQSHIFSKLRVSQKTQLQIIMKRTKADKNRVLISANEKAKCCYVVEDGWVAVKDHGKQVMTLGPGDFVGDVYSLQKDALSRFEFVTTHVTSLFRVSKRDMLEFIDRNPGVYLSLVEKLMDLEL